MINSCLLVNFATTLDITVFARNASQFENRFKGRLVLGCIESLLRMFCQRLGQPIYRHILKFHERHFFMMYIKIVHGKSCYFFSNNALSVNNFVIDVNPLVGF